MEVRRRHGGSRQSSVRSTFHEEHEDPDDDIKYHSLPESSSSASSSSDSGWISAYLAWLYEMLPSWSSFAALLSYGSSGSESLEISPEKQDRIDAFKRHIGIAWSEEDPEHLDLLRQYWDVCFPGSPFLRKDKRWTDVGFQGPDPGTDFRGAGRFGLVHLLYFASNHGDDFRKALRSGYPLSVAGLNVTMGIYQLLGWGFKKVEVSASTKRALIDFLFSDDRVIEEQRFEQLYCEAMILLDREWKFQNATYMQFPMVLAKAQETFVKTLPQIVEKIKARPAPSRPDLITF